MYRLIKEKMGLIKQDASTVKRLTRVATYKGGIDAETRATVKAFANTSFPNAKKYLILV